MDADPRDSPLVGIQNLAIACLDVISGGQRVPVSYGQRPAPKRPDPGGSRLPDAFTSSRRGRPLEGTVHSPRSRSVAVPRRRGRWLTVGVPSVLGGTLGFSTFIVLGVSSLIGGAGLLAPVLAGLGVAAVFGGGTGFLLRNRAPKPARLIANDREMPAGTRPLLEKVVRATTQQHRRLAKMRRRASSSGMKRVVNRAEALLHRVHALLGSGALRSRRASDADVLLLEGMATRYIPDLVDALEETVGSLSSFEGAARAKSFANLQSIDEQLQVLGDGIARIENDIADGVTRSLDVHSEFLKARFETQRANPISDV